MTEPLPTTGTVELHRVFSAPPNRVYRAFLDAAAMAKWLPPYGFTATVHEFDPRVGGRFHMAFNNFSTGNGHSFGGEYLELVPDHLIRYVDRFDNPAMPGEMQVRIALREVICGTDVAIVQSGIPPAIPVEFCYLGWQQSLAQLALLVEPNIPDN